MGVHQWSISFLKKFTIASIKILEYFLHLFYLLHCVGNSSLLVAKVITVIA